MLSMIKILLLSAFVEQPIKAFHDLSDDDDDCRRNTRSKVVAFNAGLTPVIENYESRKARLPYALAELDADVVCLQEVTYEADLVYIMDSLKWKYFYSWSFLHSTTTTPWEVFTSRYLSPLYQMQGEKQYPCAVPQFTAFQQCLAQKCVSAGSGLPLMLCLFFNCTTQSFALPTDCLSCLISSASSPTTAFEMCATPRSGRNRYQPEDVMVLSKKPIISARKIQFIPGITQVFPRGLLEVDVLGIGKILCTHLTSDLSGLGIPFVEINLANELNIGSYVEQQTREVEKIKNLYDGTKVIIAGDLNFGPPVPPKNIPGEVVQNYNAFIAQGFQSPYVDLVGECTYCPNNPIAVPGNDILDHVLFNGFHGYRAERVLDDVTNPLSDHYGVAVSFCKSRRYDTYDD